MSKVDELLTAGIVEQSKDPEKVVYNVGFEIPKQAVEMGAFELFADYFGYRPIVNKLDEVGEPIIAEDGQAVMIDNPVSVYEACTRGIKDYAKGILQEKFLKQGEITGRQQNQQILNNLDL